MPFLKLISTIFDRLFVIVGALLGAQLPLFIQLYTQRLAGHAAELNRFLNQLRQLANQSHKTLNQYIEKFLASNDLDFANQGELMLKTVKRWEELNSSFLALTNSYSWNRPFIFFKNVQWEMAQSTLYTFKPGIQINLEGLAYMAAGAILGFCIYQLLSFLFQKIFQKFKFFSSHLFNLKKI